MQQLILSMDYSTDATLKRDLSRNLELMKMWHQENPEDLYAFQDHNLFRQWNIEDIV